MNRTQAAEYQIAEPHDADVIKGRQDRALLLDNHIAQQGCDKIEKYQRCKGITSHHPDVTYIPTSVHQAGSTPVAHDEQYHRHHSKQEQLYAPHLMQGELIENKAGVLGVEYGNQPVQDKQRHRQDHIPFMTELHLIEAVKRVKYRVKQILQFFLPCTHALTLSSYNT